MSQALEEYAVLPRETVRTILTILWVIGLRYELDPKLEDQVLVEFPRDMVRMVYDLIREIETQVQDVEVPR